MDWSRVLLVVQAILILYFFITSFSHTKDLQKEREKRSSFVQEFDKKLTKVSEQETEWLKQRKSWREKEREWYKQREELNKEEERFLKDKIALLEKLRDKEIEWEKEKDRERLEEKEKDNEEAKEREVDQKYNLKREESEKRELQLLEKQIGLSNAEAKEREIERYKRAEERTSKRKQEDEMIVREKRKREEEERKRAEEKKLEEEKKAQEELKKKEDQLKEKRLETLRAFWHRNPPDYRPQRCKERQAERNKTDQQNHIKYPTISVVICFLNETEELLGRTVVSLLERTQPEILKEIILVDDFSTIKTHPELLKNPKVKVLYNKKREGLIRARVYGADIATGDVIVFLDSHVEAGWDWAIPQLEEIMKDYRTVTIPIIDVVKEVSHEVDGVDLRYKGIFDEHLIFQWLLDHNRTEKDYHLNYNSPAMPGGLYAIHRRWWNELGKYDMEMDVWGGENVEMSLKIWQCGGRILLVPCSHFGHVFRVKLPASYRYDKDSAIVLKKNSLRVAAAWTDEYKEFFYGILTGRKDEESVKKISDFGDVSSRLAIKKNLKCNSMDWYLKNVFPELHSRIVNGTKLMIPH